MGAVGAIAGIKAVGSIVGIVGTIQEGLAADAAARYNAGIARRKAQLSLDQAAADADASDRESRKTIGSMRADFGASGVTGTGSVMDVIQASATVAELDRQNILYRGKLKAMGFLEEAALERTRGKQAIRQSRFQAASQTLTAIGSAASSFGTPGKATT